MADQEIVVVGSRYSEDAGGGGLPPHYLALALQSLPSFVFYVNLAEFLLNQGRITIPTGKGIVYAKIDTTGMTDEQIGALTKMIQNFEKNPRLKQAFEDVAAKPGEATIIFRYGDDRMYFDLSTKEWKLEPFPDESHAGFVEGTVNTDGSHTFYISINEDVVRGNLEKFIEVSAHEIYHVWEWASDRPGDAYDPGFERAADDFGDQVHDSIFKVNQAFVPDTAEYAQQTIAAGTANGDSIVGSPGRDSLDGGAGNDTIASGAGNDNVIGAAGNDSLSGGDGNDWIEGDTGMDTLVGGSGANSLFGGLDADTYFSSGSGDKVVEHGGVDRLDLSSISIESVVFSREYNDIVMAGGVQLRVGGHYNAAGRVEQFTFAEGTYAATYIEHLVSGGTGDGEHTAQPIILDLDGDGIELVPAHESRARFDTDGDGDWDRMGWFGEGDGMLVLDRNGNGRVDQYSEISFVGDFLGAGTDLEGLYAFDNNHDGFLTAADERFGDFQVWLDNGNGQSTGKELFSLAELGIASLSLEALERSPFDHGVRDNQIVGKTFFERTDGSRGDLADVAFFVEPGAEPMLGSGRPSQLEAGLSEVVIA